ncbi:hypothetical protein DRP05_15325 [Archaeoglobales archaeon]|nr:MAG: hypothetical protein DRP05_15325 [Archaeoglobales archaeon]
MKFISDRISDRILKTRSVLEKLASRVFKKDRSGATLVVVTVLLFIQGISLSIALAYRIVVTYFRDYLIYFTTMLVSIYWLSTLGIVILVAYFLSKKTGNCCKSNRICFDNLLCVGWH